MLEQTAQQLALKGAELERQGDIERAELLTAAEKERVAMRAELMMLAQLREAREREGGLEQRCRARRLRGARKDGGDRVEDWNLTLT